MQLELEAVSKTYANGTRALDAVTLRIPTGMFGLLGPNGAGKSTLMRSIATLQSVDAGSLHFGEIDIRTQPERLREVLGYLPQDFGVYPKVSAWDMLEHMAELKGLFDRAARREAVTALLHKTNLWQHRSQRLGGFSGGMKQRFGIAQALLGNPKLIIVDEPTAGLDPAERMRFHELLAEISEDVVVLLSTHIVSDVSELCQNMAILSHGRVVLAGRPLVLTRELEGKIWQCFVDGSELETLSQRLDVVAVRRVAGRRVLRVYSEGLPAAGFEPSPPDLEDVYFHALAVAARSV
ncbi:MAG TPA: ABC transporter ATP-binding protein [Polyangiales bacterium]|nr:ABC transporter ATP-binding protein [Polyangiales bacterium]